jgi:hypothetical protein
MRKLGKETGLERLSLMNQDGTSIGSWQGKKSEVIITGKIKSKILKSADNSLICLHNNSGGSSFSLADLDVMCSFESIKEMWVIGHNGKSYFMAIVNGQRVTLQELEYFEKLIYNTAYDEVARKATQGIRTNYYSERNRLIAEHFGWIYKEGKLNGK